FKTRPFSSRMASRRWLAMRKLSDCARADCARASSIRCEEVNTAHTISDTRRTIAKTKPARRSFISLLIVVVRDSRPKGYRPRLQLSVAGNFRAEDGNERIFKEIRHPLISLWPKGVWGITSFREKKNRL